MKSPFKFLDSFTKEDREIFFGREKEIEEIYQRVFRGKIMLVYGISGTGKSSLINCGLANKFRDEDWLPLNIRRGKNMLESMYSAIVSASLTPRSQYSDSEVQFKKYVKSLYLDHYKPIYFIFDQFEELFIFGSKEEKSLFVRVIKTLVDSDIQCRFIFVMREEYMANVTEFEKHIPIFFSNRVRIENMDINNAIQAIKGPCKVFNISTEDGFPEALIENLSPGSPDIELTYLQVFLDKVYRLSMAESGSGELDSHKISFTIEQLRKIGNVSDLLGTFLNEQISLLSDPDTALAVLKSFVSIKGTKRQMNLDEVKEYSQTLGKPINDAVLLEMLQNFVHLRILRDKDQHERYELRHDSLATKIYEKISVVEKDILEIRQFIEDGYHNWQKRGILLNASDLDYIAPYESRLFLSSELLNLVNQSKNQLERIKQKRRAIFIASTIALLVAFAGFTVWALIESNVSRKNEIIANANYYNALSKELLNIDPTKALRIAGYACKLDPSENNYQNMVNIYSDNEFYFSFLPTRSYTISDFKVLNQKGNIALKENNKFKIIDSQGRTIVEPKLILPQDLSFQDWSFDISPDEKKILIYPFYRDSLKVYDYKWNIKSKIYLQDYYISDAKFVTDTSIVITAVTRSGFGKIFFWSLNGNVTETKESFLYSGFVIFRYSSDTVFYIDQQAGKLYSWNPNKNSPSKKVLQLNTLEKFNSGQFIGADRIALLTDYDSVKIYDLEGRLIKSWNAADEENRNFYRLYFIKDINLICAQNSKMVKFWDLNGKKMTNLKLNGTSIINYQYYSFSKELLTLANNHIVSYKPANLNSELVLKPEGKEYIFHENGNCFIEDSRASNRINLISIKGDSLVRTKIEHDDSKFYYKLPGNEIYCNFHDSYKFYGKHIITIYDVNKMPLVQLKDSIKYPYKIVFSKDGNLIATAGEIETRDSLTYVTPGLIKLFNKNGKLLKKSTANSYNIKISDDSRYILSMDDKNIFLRDTSDKPLYRYSVHKGYLYTYDISMDNNFILSGADDKTVRLWSRNGKLLKVILTEMYSPIAFLPHQLIFQIADNTGIKLYNTAGVLIQKIPSTQGDLAVFSPENRFIYYSEKDGIYRTTMKIPVDSFLLSNSYNDLSFAEKMEYNIITIKDILKSKNPYDVYQAGMYYLDNISKKSDVSEIKKTIMISEQLFNKVLTFDTLHVPIACSLSDLYFEKYQYYKVNLNKEIDRCFKIMTESAHSDELLEAFKFYAERTDSTTIPYKYPEKAITICEKLLELNPYDKNLRYQVAVNCNNLAFSLRLSKDGYKTALTALKIGMKADSTYLLLHGTLPLIYMLNNMYSEAEAEYLKWKDTTYTNTTGFKGTLREGYLMNIEDLESRGITHPDFAKAKELLKK